MTITIKYRLGHYKRELTTPSLSKKPKEKRASLFGQKFGLHMLSGSLKHVTHRHLCQRSKRHVMCAQGKALAGYTCGKLAEAYIAMAGDDEAIESNAQEVSDKYRMFPIT